MHGAPIGILFFAGAIALVSRHAVLALEQLIVVGKYRQLFVDDHPIANIQGVKRVLNKATRHPPVLVPEHPWEGNSYLDGMSVLYDESEKLFQMWYTAWGPKSGTRGCYATSVDGIHWKKPKLGLLEFGGSKDNNLTPWRGMGMIHSPGDSNPARRYKSLAGRRGRFSGDGIHWQDPPQASKNIPGDIVSDNVIPFCYDELSGRYVAFGKVNRPSGKHDRRSVSVAFSRNFLEWTKAEPVLIPDAEDDKLAVVRSAKLRDHVVFFDEDAGLRNAQFYGLCGFPYEGFYLGLLWVFDISGWMPGVKKISAAGGEDGPLQVELVSSRDLLHWNRVGDRELLIPVGAKGSWDAGQIYTVNRPITVGDEIWIYYGGNEHTHGHPMYGQGKEYPGIKSGVGLATLRLDGWVSMDAGSEEGTLTTKPLVFEGQRKLVINAKAAKGSVVVEILDRAGKPLPGLAKSDCEAFSGDAIRHTVDWNGQADLSELAGKPVRLRFYLQDAKLFSFTVAEVIDVSDF